MQGKWNAHRNHGRYEGDLADGAARQVGHKVLLQLLVIGRFTHDFKISEGKASRKQRRQQESQGSEANTRRRDAMAWRVKGDASSLASRTMKSKQRAPGSGSQLQRPAGAGRGGVVFVCGKSKLSSGMVWYVCMHGQQPLWIGFGASTKVPRWQSPSIMHYTGHGPLVPLCFPFRPSESSNTNNGKMAERSKAPG